MQDDLRECITDYRIVIIRVHAHKFSNRYCDNPESLALGKGMLSLKGCAGSNLDGCYARPGQDEIWSVVDDVVSRRRMYRSSMESGGDIKYLVDE